MRRDRRAEGDTGGLISDKSCCMKKGAWKKKLKKREDGRLGMGEDYHESGLLENWLSMHNLWRGESIMEGVKGGGKGESCMAQR